MKASELSKYISEVAVQLSLQGFENGYSVQTFHTNKGAFYSFICEETGYGGSIRITEKVFSTEDTPAQSVSDLMDYLNQQRELW